MFESARQQLFVIIAVLVLLALPDRAAAQAEAFAPVATLEMHPTAPSRGSSAIFKVGRLPLSVTDTTDRTAALQDVRRRDSLVNGVLIGAAIGAAAFGTFAGIVCKAQQEPEGPSCTSDTLRIAAIGAAIGAGGGLAVDAAFTRQSGARVSVGIRF